MERFDRVAVRYFQDIIKKPEIQEYFHRFFMHHRETARHSYRVGILCVELGIKNGMADYLHILAEAGALHDVGKLHITAALLDKTGELVPEEKVILESHPHLGFLELIFYQPEIVRRIVVAHHEFQNHAYPRNDAIRIDMPPPLDGRSNSGGNRDQLVDMLAQIVSAADMYDSGLNRRAYKPRRPETKVIENMRQQYTGDHKFINQLVGHSK